MLDTKENATVPAFSDLLLLCGTVNLVCVFPSTCSGKRQPTLEQLAGQENKCRLRLVMGEPCVHSYMNSVLPGATLWEPV